MAVHPLRAAIKIHPAEFIGGACGMNFLAFSGNWRLSASRPRARNTNVGAQKQRP